MWVLVQFGFSLIPISAWQCHRSQYGVTYLLEWQVRHDVQPVVSADATQARSHRWKTVSLQRLQQVLQQLQPSGQTQTHSRRRQAVQLRLVSENIYSIKQLGHTQTCRPQLHWLIVADQGWQRVQVSGAPPQPWSEAPARSTQIRAENLSVTFPLSLLLPSLPSIKQRK